MSLMTEHSSVLFRRPNQSDRDFMLYPEPPSHSGYASPPLDVDVSPDAYNFAHGIPEGFPSVGFEPVYTDATQFLHKGRTSPTSMYHDEAELQMPSNLSTASAPSAPSSTVGSPHSNPGQLAFMPEYQQHTGLGVSPGIVGHGDYFNGTEYYSGPGMEEFMHYDSKSSFVGELEHISQANKRSPLHPRIVFALPILFMYECTARRRQSILAWSCASLGRFKTVASPALAPASQTLVTPIYTWTASQSALNSSGLAIGV